jgi:hypothetical protein
VSRIKNSKNFFKYKDFSVSVTYPLKGFAEKRGARWPPPAFERVAIEPLVQGKRGSAKRISVGDWDTQVSRIENLETFVSRIFFTS